MPQAKSIAKPSSKITGLPIGVAWIIGILLVTAVVYQLLVTLVMGTYVREFVKTSLVVPVALAAVCAIPLGKRVIRYESLALLGIILLIAYALVLNFYPTIQIGNVVYHFSLPWPRIVTVWILQLVLGVAGATAAAVALARQGFQRTALLIAFACSIATFATSIRLINAMDHTGMDVWYFNNEAPAALLHGQNPFEMTFANVYAPKTNDSPFYSREVQQNGRVMFGYPYPPLCLMLFTLAAPLVGDPRYIVGLCAAACGIVTALVSRGRIGIIAAGLILISPALFSMVNTSYTDYFVLLSLCAVAWAGVRRSPTTLAVMLGLFFATKQYSVIFAPLLYFILPRPLNWRSSIRWLSIVFGVTAVISLPLALWNWRAFWHSNVYIQMIQPFRYDSFSYLAWYADRLPKGSPPPSSAVAFIMLLPTWAILLWRMPRNIAGFVLGTAITMTIFLLFNRQAFMNYHTFAASSLLVAAATLEGVYGVSSRSAALATAPAAE